MPTLLFQNDTQNRLDSILYKYTHDSDSSKNIPGIVAGIANDKSILYLGSSGVRNINAKPTSKSEIDDNKCTTDTLFLLFSTTKAFTITALFQLIERGKCKLDDELVKYLPELKLKKVIKSIDSTTGAMELEDVIKQPTIKNLVTHTAGFAYAFFNEKYKSIQDNTGRGNILGAKYEEFDVPYANQPGSKWEYGSNIDFLGEIVSRVSGVDLEEYLKENIFKPLGMNSTKFTRDESDNEKLSWLHIRDNNNNTGFATDLNFTPLKPEFKCGGHGCFGTVEDYLKFLQMFLNKGVSPITGETILKESTINENAFKNQLNNLGEGDIKVISLPGVQPIISNDVNFYPNVLKTWSDFFMINEEELETGRSAGSCMWTGLANLFYFIDYKKKLVGYWAESVFPFFDHASVNGFAEFETEAFKSFT
ncbi:uncharacterized protein SCODWIG_00435 [Saccharomycodes ludwigii]|uniref:Beta-lactamase-related domain-containing protein n=1 Tax=Saccharomycodes ludwigii TaxID=36035 RepID=A0A376B2G2_9ASCO|nr:conserved putative acyltransferase [Saccharomycodes ludwigii]KAH3903416.1 conserved putative acyltransferase [Saccharomycodes ludwigii]SSD58674.1 uncharacterized protein SCODWIG_00435 [Saccharomycodes ludwigii]